MAADFAFMNGASRVILIDSNWRLEFAKSKIPQLETLNYAKLGKGESVTSKLRDMTDKRGVDVAIECVAGEYAKGWAHYFEMLLGMETDTSEIVNEMITSCRNYGRCGITGVYAGYVSNGLQSKPMSLSLMKALDEPLQYRVAHAAWRPPNWQWPSTSSEILERPLSEDRIR